MPISHFNLPPLETYLSVLEILKIKLKGIGITMENCLKSRYFSALIKVVIDIRGTSVMFVKGMCISTLWSFQNQCHVNTLQVHVPQNICKIYFLHRISRTRF